MKREFIRSFVITHHRMSHALPLAGPLFFVGAPHDPQRPPASRMLPQLPVGGGA